MMPCLPWEDLNQVWRKFLPLRESAMSKQTVRRALIVVEESHENFVATRQTENR